MHHHAHRFSHQQLTTNNHLEPNIRILLLTTLDLLLTRRYPPQPHRKSTWYQICNSQISSCSGSQPKCPLKNQNSTPHSRSVAEKSVSRCVLMYDRVF